MSRLVYFTIASLDGYIEDEHGRFGWAQPDEEAHAFANELIRPIGTHLYGRRMYETMQVWETLTEGPPVIREFAELWRAADKIVFSRMLALPASSRTRIEREFRPEDVRRHIDESGRDASVAGAELAAVALRARIVDEYHVLIAPYVAGGGKPALPSHLTLRLELQDERRFRGGMVYLRYGIRY